jgi:hypothetical protein
MQMAVNKNGCWNGSSIVDVCSCQQCDVKRKSYGRAHPTARSLVYSTAASQVERNQVPTKIRLIAMQKFQNKALNSTSPHLFTNPPSVEMPMALFGTAYFRGASLGIQILWNTALKRICHQNKLCVWQPRLFWFRLSVMSM